jgi:hypothetical protein
MDRVRHIGHYALVPSLRAIGYWMGPHAPNWPAVEGFVDPLADASDRDAIAAALDRGTATDRAYMGFSECRVCGCRNGSGERTNATFVWPDGLSHYVREHQVRLPEQVEDELLANQRPDEQLLLWAASADDSFRDYEWWRSLSGPT